MNQSRPVNLNLLTIKFPVTAIVSILHRISGVILFLAAPFLLWLLRQSLHDASHFQSLQTFFAKPGIKFTLWVLLSAFFYHLVAGIRHLFMDMHLGVSKRWGTRGAYLVLILAFILILSTGYWLCCSIPQTLP